MTDIIFLKLGGPLITDKTRPYSPRLDSIERLVGEIRSVLVKQPGLRLVIGHGSGSFGHFAVREALTPHAYPPPEGSGPEAARGFWKGFAEVWYRASLVSQLPELTVQIFSGEEVGNLESALNRQPNGTMIVSD